MNNICLYFQIHHPFNLQTFRYFDTGKSRTYYDHIRMEKEIKEMARNYILPANESLLKLIEKTGRQLKVTFYISGTALDLFLAYSPEVLNSFRQLADTKAVEFAGGTATHSIVSLSDQRAEFLRQAKRYSDRIEYFFDQKPRLFVNSDLLYSDEIAEMIFAADYPAVLTNGTQKMLRWRSPNYLYTNEYSKSVRLFLRNEELSNNLAALFSDRDFALKSPYTSEFLKLLKTIPAEEPVVNIFMNYHNLAGLKNKEKQAFFSKMISGVIENFRQRFALPSEIINHFGPIGSLNAQEPVCWKEHFHPDYYPGNDMQKDAINQLFKLSKKVDSVNDYSVKTDWQYLQTSDHFHQIDDNYPFFQPANFFSGSVKSKYDAYINFMNILDDFKERIKLAKQKEVNENKVVTNYPLKRTNIKGQKGE